MKLRRKKQKQTHQRKHEIRIRPARVDMAVGVEAPRVRIWYFCGRIRYIAEAEDEGGLRFGPGKEGWGDGGRVAAGVRLVGGGHGVAGVGVAFGVHFGGLGWGW